MTDRSNERDEEKSPAILESPQDRPDDRAASSPHWGSSMYQERFRSPHNHDPLCPFLKTNAGCIWCCNLCNYDEHVCMGCGTPLTHLSRDTKEFTKHVCP